MVERTPGDVTERIFGRRGRTDGPGGRSPFPCSLRGLAFGVETFGACGVTGEVEGEVNKVGKGDGVDLFGGVIVEELEGELVLWVEGEERDGVKALAQIGISIGEAARESEGEKFGAVLLLGEESGGRDQGRTGGEGQEIAFLDGIGVCSSTEGGEVEHQSRQHLHFAFMGEEIGL